jgi:glutaredoxin
MEKLTRILEYIGKIGMVSADVIQGALAGRTAFPKSFLKGDENDLTSAKAMIQHVTSIHAPLIVIGKTWCKHCKRVLRVMEENDIHPFILWMDRRMDESNLQMLLLEKIISIKKKRTNFSSSSSSGGGDGGGDGSISSSISSNSSSGGSGSSSNSNSGGSGSGGIGSGDGNDSEEKQDDITFTVPQVFYSGILIGGADQTIELIQQMKNNSTDNENSNSTELNIQLHDEYWYAKNTTTECWDWIESMNNDNELLHGLEYYKCKYYIQ